MKFYLSALIWPSAILAQAPECYLPIDVMFLQDTTGSFQDDLPNVVRQIPDMVNAIITQNPDSYFGVSEFKDKPYYFVGETSDFCYKLNGPLTPSVEIFKHDYSTLYASGGGDLPESQFQALIDVTEDPAVGWRPIERPARSGSNNAGARLIIISTDARPHLPDDILSYAINRPDTPIGSHPFSPNPGVGSGIPIDTLCRDYNYPSDIQVKTALNNANVYLAILTPDDPKIVPAWRYINEQLLGQPPAFYQFIENDSSNLLGGVLAAIKAVTETACAAPPITTTSTLPPSTMPPTTLPPTTLPPTTLPPTTVPPTTVPPTTVPPTTVPPTTVPPTTVPPTTVPTTTPFDTPYTTTSSRPSPSVPAGDCHNPCPPEPEPCCHRAAVVVKVNDRPKLLKVDYIK